MKYLSELRADDCTATYWRLHCLRSAFQTALYATFPWGVSAPSLLSARPKQTSIVRFMLHVLRDLSRLSVAGNTRHLKLPLKVEMLSKLVAHNHVFLGRLHPEVLEVTA